MTPGGLFRQDSDRLGHGKKKIEPRKVYQSTLKRQNVTGGVKTHVHRAGLGIVAELYRWTPGGGCYRISVFCALYLGQNAIFRQKKPKKISAQK